MCESGFGFKSGFRAFWAGFGFGLLPPGPSMTSWIRIRIRIHSGWIRIQGKRGGFRFSWIRIRGAWIRIRIRIRDPWIRTSLFWIRIYLLDSD